jgi:FtsZ-binding cell division protein ZapB
MAKTKTEHTLRGKLDKALNRIGTLESAVEIYEADNQRLEQDNTSLHDRINNLVAENIQLKACMRNEDCASESISNILARRSAISLAWRASFSFNSRFSCSTWQVISTSGRPADQTGRPFGGGRRKFTSYALPVS